MSAVRLKIWIAKRHHGNLVIAICLFALAGLPDFGLKALQAEYFPVRSVRIQGALKYLDKSDVERALRPLLECGYWDLDLEGIRFGALQLVWIKAVQIQRVWPDTLVLKVEEHVPFARFAESQLISTQGVLLSPGDLGPFAGLPLINGAITQSAHLLDAFQAIQVSAGDAGVTLEQLHVSERGSWFLQLAGGLSIEVGREKPIQTFRRFLSTLSLLGEKTIQSMVRVDLRYPNGYAVEWKSGSEPEWSSFVKQRDLLQNEAAQHI